MPIRIFTIGQVFYIYSLDYKLLKEIIKMYIKIGKDIFTGGQPDLMLESTYSNTKKLL